MPPLRSNALLYSLFVLVCLAAVVVPVLMYWHLVVDYSINAPVGSDDADLVINDVSQLMDAASPGEAAQILFKETAEHRPAMLRLISLLSYAVTGSIDLHFINVFSTALLLLSLVMVLSNAHRTLATTLGLFAITMPLLVSPITTECLNWASCTSSHFVVVAMGVFAVFFMPRTGWCNYLASLLLSLVAVFSHIQGMALLGLGGLAILLFQPRHLRAPMLVFHCVLTATLIFLYFRHHEANVYLAQEYTLYIHSLSQWWLGLQVSFAFTGIWASPAGNMPLAIATGAAEMLLVAVVLWKYRLSLVMRYPVPMLFTAYILLILLIGGFQRGWLIHDEIVVPTRYRLYSLVLLAMLVDDAVLLAGECIDNTGSRLRLALACLLVSTGSLWYFSQAYAINQPLLAAEHQRLSGCVTEWQQTGEAWSCLWHHHNKELMDDAARKHRFQVGP